jgi:predicted AAA+ superfamily ATPase
VLHGARQVGKTSIMRYILDGQRSAGRSVHYIDLEDSRMLKLLNGGVEDFLRHLKEEGLIVDGQISDKLFVFIDEIQYLENPSSFLKLMADHHPGIKLIVSGSSSFAIKTKFQDSLVGRTVDFEIFPLSFREFLLFKQVPFDRSNLPFTEKKSAELKTLFREYVLYGGYPQIVLTPDLARKEKYLQQIIDTYVRKDIRDLANVKDPEKFNKLLEALASQSGQVLNVTELANTTRLAKQTIEHYLFIMENTYIIRLVRPFSRNIRSELFKLPKLFFYDTGIMQMLWLKRLQQEIIGQVFETAIFGELSKEYPKDALFYWRNKDKKEIDFILNCQNMPLPLEVKLNFGQFNPSAVNYFNSRYGQEDYRLVGLEGNKRDVHSVYPWEM